MFCFAVFSFSSLRVPTDLSIILSIELVSVSLTNDGLTFKTLAQQHGEYVMEELRKIDDVAYVRFASVYRKFQDKIEFLKELDELKH